MFTCQICGWSTNSAAEMVGHMSRHKRFCFFKISNISKWS